MQLELVLLAWCLKKMEEELGEAPSSKEDDEGKVAQLAGVDLRRPPVKFRRGGGFNCGGGKGAPPWLELERERESEEGERVSWEGGCAGVWGRLWMTRGAGEVRWQTSDVRVTCV